MEKEKMVKLVLCDIDGTLLEKGETRVSAECADALEALLDAGKTVALASGRAYAGMRRLVEHLPFAEELYYICDDGALCIHHGKTLYHKPLSVENLLRFAREPAYDTCPVLYFSTDFSYVLRATPEFLQNAEQAGLDRFRPIGGVYEIKEPIYKIGICGRSERPPLLVPQPFDLRVCYNADKQLEYASRFADKGLAASDLQMRLYLSKWDTAALGDGENDISLFSKAKYTYARQDGSRALCAAANETFASGQIASVLRTLLDR